jgi:hypothetical protein
VTQPPDGLAARLAPPHGRRYRAQLVISDQAMQMADWITALAPETAERDRALAALELCVREAHAAIDRYRLLFEPPTDQT